MKVSCSYHPKFENARKGTVDLFYYFKYKMYDELSEEFPTKQPAEHYIKMEKLSVEEEDDKVEYYYELEIDLPYGKIDDKKIVGRPNNETEDDPKYELKPIPANEE